MSIDNLSECTDSQEIIKLVRKDAEGTPGAKSSLTGDTAYYEVGYLASALANSNKKNQELQQRLDIIELESNPFNEVKSQLDYIEDKIQGVYDKVV